LPTSTPKQPEQCRMSQSIAQQKSAGASEDRETKLYTYSSCNWGPRHVAQAKTATMTMGITLTESVLEICDRDYSQSVMNLISYATVIKITK